jgi:acetoin utilization deacetylase AcuC-like enzyme
MTAGLVWDERLMWHDTGPLAAHIPPGPWVEPDVPAESPVSKRRIHHLLQVSGLAGQLVEIAARPATDAELGRVHDEAYLGRLAVMSSEQGGEAGEGAPFTHGSYEIARVAAGGCVEAVRAVTAGAVPRAYALVRPPGHHAERHRGVGFCLLANVAIAVAAGLAEGSVERVAVVDWDVHHGNGTQAAFWDDPRVLTVSIHQDPGFPTRTGGPEQTGGPAAPGTNLNVPLPPGSGTGAYLAALDRLVLPALYGFEPDLIVVASGVDACALDPYGRMLLHSESYRALTRRLVAAAEELCAGRVLGCHEGGYSTAYAPFCTLAVIEELAGVRTAVEDPFLDELAQMDGQELEPHQVAALEQVARQARATLERSARPG